jgi:hypothetical protein
MSEVMTLPTTTVVDKLKIEEVFDQSFIELIKLVPANPYVRALILRLTGKMPEQDCATFEQVKEWVEANCKKRIRPGVNPLTVPDDGISIRVEFSETEYGRANYSVPRSGTDQFQIGAEELVEIVQDAIDEGGGIDQIVETIAQKIDDDAWSQCEPSLDDCGDYDYTEHDSNDSGDSDATCSKAEIQNAVLLFLRDRHPELAAEL